MGREWDSAAYHRLSDPQLGWALKVIDKLKPAGVSPDAHILDVGCGTGRVTSELLRRFPSAHVTAIDASENMLREASVTLRSFGQRVKLEQIDILEIAYSHSFDLVFSTAVFHWIKDHSRLFDVLFRVLKPDGLLIAQCGGGANLQRIRDRVQQRIESEKYSSYFTDWEKVWEYPGPEVTQERLRQAGFAGVSTSLEPAPLQFAEAGVFRDFLRAVILHPYLERLPATLQRELENDLVEQAAQDDPPFVLDYWRLNMQGWKRR